MIQINMNLVYTHYKPCCPLSSAEAFPSSVPVTQVMEKRKQMVEEGFKNAQDMQDQAALKMKQEYEEALSGAKQGVPCGSWTVPADPRKAEYDRDRRRGRGQGRKHY